MPIGSSSACAFFSPAPDSAAAQQPEVHSLAGGGVQDVQSGMLQRRQIYVSADALLPLRVLLLLSSFESVLQHITVSKLFYNWFANMMCY
jgi:hypothetical protein